MASRLVLMLEQSSLARGNDAEEVAGLQLVVARVADFWDKMKSLEDSTSLLDDEVKPSLEVCSLQLLCILFVMFIVGALRSAPIGCSPRTSG